MNNLNDFFAENPRLAIAFSGGVDSAYLLHEALEHCEQVRAYYVSSPFQPKFEQDDAERLAMGMHADLRILPIDVLSEPCIAENPPDRCYHCKKRIFTEMINAAREDGFFVLADGTNDSDDEELRPGMRALAELSVRSPCASAGLQRGRSASAPATRGFLPGTNPPMPALRPAFPPGKQSLPKSCGSPKRPSNIYSQWASAISAFGCAGTQRKSRCRKASSRGF